MPNINYQARDFESIKGTLIEYARQNYPEWTDLNESEQGMILVELYAYVGDVLHRYIDRQADEFDVDRATQRRSMISLMKLIGYRMRGATAARCPVVISVEEPAQADIIIPKGFKVYTKDMRDPIVYEVTESGHKIAAGQTSVEIVLTQGETETQYHNFNGTADQSVKLDLRPYIEGSVVLDIDGEPWHEIENLLDSASSDRHFFVETNERDEAVLKFGDGHAGIVPRGSGSIQYRIGGGTAGRVGSNTLTLPESPQLLDVNGVPVTITTTNPTSSVGGEDKESIDEARVNGPNSNKANERTVSRQDYNNHPQEVEGVARALTRFREDDESIPANVAIIQVIPEGGGTPSQLLKDSVKNYLYEVKPVQTTVVVDPVDPKYRVINTDITVVPQPGYDRQDVAARTAQAARDFLNDYTATDQVGQYKIDWGMTIYPDDLAIKVEGCRSVKVNEPAEPIECAADEIPAPGNIVVN